MISYIALGSNLCDPEKQLVKAVNALCQLDACHVVGGSRLYRSAPLGPSGQPDYYNAVVALETVLSPEQLLDRLQAIENAQGRVRKERWGARTLDLDILLYGSQIIQTPRLTVPHARMHLRNFVIFPLLDLAPELILPTGESVCQLSLSLGKDGLCVESDLPLAPETALL